MLEWGALDQDIYSHVFLLQRKRTMEDAPIDDRFARRRKHFRRLVAAAPKNAHLLPRLDSLYTRLDDLERQRAHFAHGRVFVVDGTINVVDHRERAVFEETAPGRTAAEFRALWDRHLVISYTPDHLDELAKGIASLREGLAAVFVEAMTRDRWPDIPPLPGH